MAGIPNERRMRRKRAGKEKKRRQMSDKYDTKKPSGGMPEGLFHDTLLCH